VNAGQRGALIMKDKMVVSAIAFFDTREFDEFWNRVPPAQ
jgi:uncharacterized protein